MSVEVRAITVGAADAFVVKNQRHCDGPWFRVFVPNKDVAEIIAKSLGWKSEYDQTINCTFFNVNGTEEIILKCLRSVSVNEA